MKQSKGTKESSVKQGKNSRNTEKTQLLVNPANILPLLSWASPRYDILEKKWDSTINQRYLGSILVFSFIILLAFIELNRQGIFGPFFQTILPTNHFVAIEVSFNVLLLFEVISLIFVIAKSFSRSLAKQFEIYSLILLRQAFKEFGHFSEPITWDQISGPFYHIIANAAGALIIFTLLGLFLYHQKHHPITADKDNKVRFIYTKKLISLFLLLVLSSISFYDFILWVRGADTFPFFRTFYTVLIFTDVLIVLISLRYSYNYPVVFRNSGYALATLLIRISLTAPAFINIAIGVFAAVFMIALTFAYDIYMHVQQSKPVQEEHLAE